MGDHPETPRPEVGKDSSRVPAASRVGASPAHSLSKSRAGRREASRRTAFPHLAGSEGRRALQFPGSLAEQSDPGHAPPPAPLSPRSCTWRRRGHSRRALPLAIGGSGARPESQYALGRAEPRGARKLLRGKGAPRLPDPSVPTGSAPETLPAGAEQGAGGGSGGGKPGLQGCCPVALLAWGDVVVLCGQNRPGARDGGNHPPTAAPLLGSAGLAGVPNQLHQSPSAAAAGEHAGQGTGPRTVGCGCAARFLAGDSAGRPDHTAL